MVDFVGGGGGGDSSEGGGGSGSGSGFLGKVWDKKNGLMDGLTSGISSKLESVSSYLPKRPSVDSEGPAGGGESNEGKAKVRPGGGRNRTRRGSDSEDSSEPEYDDGTRSMERLQLSDPEAIDDKDLDEYGRECREFMSKFVDLLFNKSGEIEQEMKSKFGTYCRSESGRMWFARQVNGMRTNNQKVSEATFFSMVQYFAVVLFECHQDEDFPPAKILMNMCFTFYHEVQPKLGFLGKSHKVYLYSYLKDQPIWQSLRFWNAAFFDAVQKERYKPTSTKNEWDSSSTTEQKDEKSMQENIVFGQLGTFTCNMRSFGLSKELCLEFVRKQSTIANLKPEQIQMLKNNIDDAPGDGQKSDSPWMPNLPELPSMPKMSMPSMPNMPSMPSMPKPSMPSMPTMPKVSNPMDRLFHRNNSEQKPDAAGAKVEPETDLK